MGSDCCTERQKASSAELYDLGEDDLPDNAHSRDPMDEWIQKEP